MLLIRQCSFQSRLGALVFPIRPKSEPVTQESLVNMDEHVQKYMAAGTGLRIGLIGHGLGSRAAPSHNDSLPTKNSGKCAEA